MYQTDCHITLIPYGNALKEQERQLFLDCLNIREQVFCIEQQVPFTIEQDGRDIESAHVLLWVQDIPIGTLRYRRTDNGLKFERIAILKEYRGLHYGRTLLREAIRCAREDGNQSQIYLHSQISAKDFYAKIGFIPEGSQMIEAGIAHIKMSLPDEAERHFLNAIEEFHSECV
jgi:predicted GNAT family N-acyltransferase